MQTFENDYTDDALGDITLDESNAALLIAWRQSDAMFDRPPKDTGEGDWLRRLPISARTLIEAIRRSNRKLEQRVAELEVRLAAVEVKPNITYRGVHESGRSYMAGDAVTKSGSLWISKLNHIKSDPGTDPVGWQLAVKRGADGRDARR
jgi:hypothetical protein